MGGVRIQSNGTLEKLSLRELKDIYAELAPYRPYTREFKSKELAVQSILYVLARQQGYVSPGHSLRSTGVLEQKTLRELVDIYADPRTDKPYRRRFRSKEWAVQAILRLLARQQGLIRRGRPPTGRSRGRPRKRLDLPCTGTIKPPRPGSIRARLVEILSRGATFDEVCATLGLSKAGAYDHIRLVHVAGGYGVREGEDGVIRLGAA